MKLKMPKKILSVSIACYNLGSLIEECLDSFLKEKEVYNQLELLVVDDGSTDDITVEKVKRYVEKYPSTVKLIQQKNSGPGATVNNGMKHATGKYFRMVDGDDWVDSAALKKLIQKLSKINSDMVVANYKTYSEKLGKITHIFKPNNLKNGKEIQLEDFEYDYNPPIRMHNTIYKTEILQKNKITLDDGFYTDLEYLLFPTPYVKTMTYFDLDLYIYRQALGDQSTSPNKLIQNRPRHKEIMDHLVKYAEDNKDKIHPNIYKYLVRQIAGCLVTHVDVLLLIGNKNLIKDLKKYFKDIEKNHPDFYPAFLIDKKTRLLKNSNFLLAYPFSIYLKIEYKLIS